MATLISPGATVTTADGNIYYSSGGAAGHVLLRSADGGVTWGAAPPPAATADDHARATLEQLRRAGLVDYTVTGDVYSFPSEGGPATHCSSPSSALSLAITRMAVAAEEARQVEARARRNRIAGEQAASRAMVAAEAEARGLDYAFYGDMVAMRQHGNVGETEFVMYPSSWSALIALRDGVHPGRVGHRTLSSR
jgi:hypothetical protein